MFMLGVANIDQMMKAREKLVMLACCLEVNIETSAFGGVLVPTF